jgi:Flp pilus assembly protein TadG
MSRFRIYPGRIANPGSLSVRRRHIARSEQGTALIETALTAVVMLTVIFGLIELSLALYTYHFVSDAAREGSRYAIVRGSDSCINTPNLTNCNATAAQIQTYLKSLGYPGLDASKLNVTTTWLAATASGTPATTTWSTCSPATCTKDPGNMVKVVVSYSFPLNILFLSKTTLNIASTSEMVIAQ